MSRMEVLWIEGLEVRRLLASLLPDVTWGNDGTVSNDPQPHLIGKVSDGFLAYEAVMNDTSFDITFNKYSDDGSSDSSFSASLEDAGTYPVTAIDSQERLVVATATPGTSHGVVVHRITSLGSGDSDFGTDGVVTLSYSGAADATGYSVFITSVATDSEGSIYIATFTTSEVDSDIFSGPYYDYTITKLTSAGQLDSSFGSGGKLSPTVADHSNYDAPWMLVDSQKRVIVGVTAQTHDQNLVERYTPAGTLDATFGTGGQAVIDPDYSVAAQQVDDQDRLVVLGRAFGAETDHDALIRLDNAGALDTTFGTGGIAPILTGTATAMRVQDDGKIIVSIIQTDSIAAVGFERFTTAGQHDATFDQDGIADASQASWIDQIAEFPDEGYLVSSIAGIQRLTFATGIALGTSGTVYVRGSDSADVVTLTRSGSQVTVQSNADTQTYALAEITGINANLQGGANSFSAASLSIPMTVQTGDGNDTITTGSGGDSITAGDGNDSITANDGQDTIDAGGGSNNISAGDGGGDITAGSGDIASNTIIGKGDYTISIHSDGLQSISLEGATASIFCYSDAGSRITLDMSESARITTGIGDDTIITTDGNDVIIPGFGNDSVTTGAGDDTVVGEDYETSDRTYDDVYDLGAGNDIVRDGYGRNTIIGGEGNDSIRTGFGDDSIDGGLGKDTVRSGDGDDSIMGGGGRDKLYAGNGNDTVWGGGNNDTLVGSDGADVLVGNRGDDLIVASDSNTSDIDHIDGGRGIDSLFGDTDEDSVSIETVLDLLA